jgi:hypothetical protein
MNCFVVSSESRDIPRWNPKGSITGWKARSRAVALRYGLEVRCAPLEMTEWSRKHLLRIRKRNEYNCHAERKSCPGEVDWVEAFHIIFSVTLPKGER